MRLEGEDVVFVICEDGMFVCELAAREIRSCGGLEGDYGREGVTEEGFCVGDMVADEMTSSECLDFYEVCCSLTYDVVSL